MAISSEEISSNIRFQLIVDAKSILLSPAPDGKTMRANINELDYHQLERILDAIVDAGEETQRIFLDMVDKKLRDKPQVELQCHT